MPNPKAHQVVEAVRLSKAPAGMATRIIAVDGPGGAGKSVLASWLGRELLAPIIHTDDFASWDHPVDWWPTLLEKVLKPIAAGDPVHYVPTNWGGPEKDPIVIEATDFVILEGVTASREAFRPYLAYSIWVQTPRQVRLARGLKRDGTLARATWSAWMEEEDRYVERERPADHVDLVLQGDSDIGD